LGHKGVGPVARVGFATGSLFGGATIGPMECAEDTDTELGRGGRWGPSHSHSIPIPVVASGEFYPKHSGETTSRRRAIAIRII